MDTREVFATVVCIRQPDGVSEVTAGVILELLRESGRVHHTFLNPGTFNVYFDGKGELPTQQANALMAGVATLARNDARYAEFKCGCAQGHLIVWDGWPDEIPMDPIGLLINRAMDAAL